MSLGEGMAQKAQPGPEQTLLARQEALFGVSRAISVHRDPKALFRVLASELKNVVKFDYIALFLYDAAANRIENAVLEAMQGPGIVIPRDFPPEEMMILGVSITKSPRSIGCSPLHAVFDEQLIDAWGVSASAHTKAMHTPPQKFATITEIVGVHQYTKECGRLRRGGPLLPVDKYRITRRNLLRGGDCD
jgi:hypothetical protein